MPTNPRVAPPAQRTHEQLPVFEIRPDATTYWRGVGVRALILLPILALGVYRAIGRDGIGWFAVLYGVLVAALVVAALTMLQTSSIVLTSTTIEKRHRWLPPKVVQRATVASGLLVPQYTSAFNRTAALLVLAGRNGRPVLRLTGQVFSGPDLLAFAERFGLAAFDVIQGVAGPKAVGERHRKILPLVERRPGLVIAAGTVVLLVAVVVGVTIFDPVS